MFDLHIYAFMCAIVGYIYSDVLTEGGMIFNSLYKWLDYQNCSGKRRLPEWIFKPIIGCFKCVAGQIALWTYLYINKSNYYLAFCNLNNIDLLINLAASHVYFICITIYITWIVNKVYRKEI